MGPPAILVHYFPVAAYTSRCTTFLLIHCQSCSSLPQCSCSLWESTKGNLMGRPCPRQKLRRPTRTSRLLANPGFTKRPSKANKQPRPLQVHEWANQADRSKIQSWSNYHHPGERSNSLLVRVQLVKPSSKRGSKPFWTRRKILVGPPGLRPEWVRVHFRDQNQALFNVD